MKIYIVYGNGGEYEDKTSWEICAYYNERVALLHADLAREFSEKAYIGLSACNSYKERSEYLRNNPNPYDMEMKFIDGVVPTYGVSELEVFKNTKTPKAIK